MNKYHFFFHQKISDFLKKQNNVEKLKSKSPKAMVYKGDALMGHTIRLLFWFLQKPGFTPPPLNTLEANRIQKCLYLYLNPAVSIPRQS